MTLDLLLVTPPSRLEVYQDLSRDFAAIEPPVWSGLIAHYMRRKGYEVRMLDAEAQGLTHKETADEILAASATLTAFVIYGQQPSASTQCMPGAVKVCQGLHDGGAAELPTLAIGTHPSALPRRTLLETPFTYVCQGEGPLTVRALTDVLRGHGNITEVPGLWYMDGEDARATSRAPLLEDLDREMPAQAWDLLDMTRYRAHNWHCFSDLDSRGRYASLQTSLGCPYRCEFCCINAPFGGQGIRYWSSETVMDQLEVLVTRYGVRNIKIPDEMFVLSKRHVLAICDGIIERGYSLNIWAYARVDTVEDQMLERLARAGVSWLGVGIESGSQYVRDGMAKGRFVNEDILRAVEKIRKHGLYVAANYIFGLPDDDHESMQRTLDLALELNTEWANFYCAMAYPGSPLYKLARENGWALPDDAGGPGWIGYAQHAYDAMPLPTDELNYEQVLDFRDRAFSRYFQSPAYLSLIRSHFGDDVVDHVRDMTAHRLRRRHHELEDAAGTS